jgi:RNA polymerase sigma factor (sigma-70 family)
MQPTHYTQFKQGDPIALEYLYKRYHRMLFWLGKELIKDEFVIETLVQDCFLKLWKHRDTIETPEHIFFFLRYVMKRECTYYYCRPRNHFYRSMSRLEWFGNYQDFMLGHDPVAEEDQHLLEQEASQKAFEQVQQVLPFLGAERQRLIELCLTYGFQYKAIAEVMGKGITETANEIKRSIEALKKIVHQGHSLEHKEQVRPLKIQGGMTPEQAEIFQLRCEQEFSFADIAKKLNLSQKEVHQAFTAAYSLMQQQAEQQLESA